MKIVMLPGEVVEIGFWNSEEDVLKVECNADSHVTIEAKLPDDNHREGVIYKVTG